MTHEDYMRQAINLARECIPDGDVPVGCVVVSPDGEIIGRGRNRREADSRATAHAEIEAINDACAALGSWRLTGCTLYVTLEPCPMCAGALGWSQIGRIVYGTSDPKRGFFSYFNPARSPIHPKTTVEGGLLEEECRQLMTDFFKKLRK